MTARRLRLRLLWLTGVVFILADLGYSGLQYYHQPLDGDVAWNLVPAREVEPILSDPLGVQTWWAGHRYPNPNRFFSHWAYRTYFLETPRLLRWWFDPVTSVYLAAALAKLVVHLGLLLLLARLVVGHWRLWSLPFVAVVALLTPLFQGSGYRSSLGIVDPAVSYTFFYALPAAVLLFFLLPFADYLFHGIHRRFSALRLLGWGVLAVVVTLSGPLNPATLLVLTAVGIAGWVTLHFTGKSPSLPRSLLVLWGWAVALSAYSLYVGSYNSLTLDNHLPLGDLYARLPEGIIRQFTTKLAWPVLLLAVGIQQLWLYRSRPDSRTLIRLGYGVACFAGLYVLLLPLGGYREYRPFVLRYDTLLPITLAVLLLYAAGARHLWRSLSARAWCRAWPLPLAVGVIFTLADQPDFGRQQCEESALRVLATTHRDTVPLPNDCPVLSWEVFTDPAWSEQNVRLLRAWRIVDRPLGYHHPK